MLHSQIAQGYKVCCQLQAGFNSQYGTWQMLRWPLSATMCMECFAVLHMKCLYSLPTFPLAKLGWDSKNTKDAPSSFFQRSSSVTCLSPAMSKSPAGNFFPGAKAPSSCMSERQPDAEI